MLLYTASCPMYMIFINLVGMLLCGILEDDGMEAEVLVRVKREHFGRFVIMIYPLEGIVASFSNVARRGFTTITGGQLEAVSKYHDERALQYEVLSLLSRAPGQMNGNFYRIINEFEDYNKANPERKV